MKFDRQSKTLIVILGVAVAGVLLGTANRTLSLGINPEVLGTVILGAPALLLVLHSVWSLGAARSAFFILLAAVTGLLFEIWGLTTGTVFGGRYVYNGPGLQLWGVPYVIPIYWAVFIYAAYSITNAFLRWRGAGKPARGRSKFTALVPLIALDGLITVLLDLILDPVKVHEGAWTWLDGGSYFGIPLGNFAGWFIVTILVTGIFRVYEYFRPRHIEIHPALSLLPVVAYGTMGLALGLAALSYSMYAVAALSLVLMLPVSLANMAYFASWRRHGSIKSK